MLSGEAVFMVYLQLCEFRLPARGCSWKTVPETFRVPQPLVLSWSSDIPAQCHQPQVCLSCCRKTTINRRGIIDSLGLLLFFRHFLFGGVTHARLRFSSSLAGIETESDPGPIKISKGFQMSCLRWLFVPWCHFHKWIGTRHCCFSIMKQFVSVCRSLHISQRVYEPFMVYLLLLTNAVF